jgi:hypothetical protein
VLRRSFGVFCVLAVVAVALFVAMPAGAAGNAGTTQATTFDPTGAVFTCSGGTSYTVTGGTAHSIFHDSFGANGSEHVTGTIAVTGVTATDGTSTYRIVGATWFGGNLNYATGQFEFSDTGHFNIIDSSGAVVGTVSTVEHMGAHGSSFSFDFGNCQEPQD